MKSIIIKAFLTINLFLSLQFNANAQSFRLFHIERNKNSSIVCYDLKINENNEICTENPIDIYWEMPDENNDRNALSLIQNKLAYGITLKKIEKNSVFFKLKAYPDCIVNAVYNQEKREAKAHLLINGHSAVLNKLYICAIPPNYTSVEYIILYGFEPETGKNVMEKIINK